MKLTKTYSSFNLLASILHSSKIDETLKNTFADIAAAYDPTYEIKPDSYDSPWRSLGLIFSLTDRPEQASWAFNKAFDWFEAALAVTEGAHEDLVLRGALLTMQTLCQLQAGQVKRISAQSFQKIKECLDEAMGADIHPRFLRHLYMNYARLGFLASRFGIDNASEFVEKAQLCYELSLPVHPSIRFLVEELDLLRQKVRLSIEVADSDELNNTFAQLFSLTSIFQKASLEGAWEIGTDLGVCRVLKSFLATVDMCAPTPSEASRAIDLVADFLIYQNLQLNQSIRDRASLLIVRSIFLSGIPLEDVSEIIKLLQDTNHLRSKASRRLKLSENILSKQIDRAMADFTEIKLMHFCNKSRSINSQIEFIQSVFSVVTEAKILIGNDIRRAVAVALLKDLKTPEGITKEQVSKAAEQFGLELRMRIDQFSEDDKFGIKSHLKGEALAHCDRFFETAIEATSSSYNESRHTISFLREAAMIYSHARLKPGTKIWNTALQYLESSSASFALSVLTTWILEDEHLKQKLWENLLPPNLQTVLDLLSRHDKNSPGTLSSGMIAIMNNNQTAILEILFGSNPDLHEIMLPVIRCVLDANSKTTTREVLLTWVTAKRGWDFDYEYLARETIASLLKFSEDSRESIIYEQAARQLVTRKIAAITTREQPRLAPIVAKFLVAQVKIMCRVDLERQLVSKEILEEFTNTNLVEMVNNLSDTDAIDLLNIMCQDATHYTYFEFLTVRHLTLALLFKEGVWQQLKEESSEEQGKNILQLLIRYFPPSPPIARWYSASWSGNPENALSHEEVFAACRHLVELLLQSTQMTHHTLNTLINWNCTTIWELARWLAAVRTIAEGSSTTGEVHRIACHVCLEAILNSTHGNKTYDCGEGKKYTVQWREKSSVPAVVADTLLPMVLKHAVGIVSVLPQEVDPYHERRQVLCAAVPILAGAGVLDLVCSDLIDRVPNMRWGEERTLCLAIIEEAIQIDSDKLGVAQVIEAKLNTSSSKELWIKDQDLVSLLCGLPSETGNRFMELFYKQITPAQIIGSEELWEIIRWIAQEIKAPNDLFARLIELIRIAQEKASNTSTRIQGLGAWATIISAVCSKIGSYRSAYISHTDALRMIEFADMPVFGQCVEELWRESPEQVRSTGRHPINATLDEWERVAIKLIKEVPDKIDLNCVVAIPSLLRLREIQVESKRVNNIVDTIAQTDLVLQNPELVVSCIEVCLTQQDLDGVETLFHQGLATTAKASTESGATFLARVLSTFWCLNEFRLSLLYLKNILWQLQVSPHEVSEKIIEDVLKLTNKKLRLEFQNPPNLSLTIDSSSGLIGGQYATL